MPLVSIVIPIYNLEVYLQECLDSLRLQTLKDIEIICVDDASTDRSLEIAERYAAMDPRFKVYKLPVNSRQGAARNLGIQMAAAPYIGFVDSDDFVASNYFENLYSAIIRHDADIVMTSYQSFDEVTKGMLFDRTASLWAGWRHHRRHRIKLFLKLLGAGWECDRDFSAPELRCRASEIFMVMNKLYKKSLVEQVRFPEGIQYEDMAFTPEIFYRAKSVFSTPCGGYYYRRHPKSTTQLKTYDKLLEKILVIKLADHFFAETVGAHRDAEPFQKLVQSMYRIALRELATKAWLITPERWLQLRRLCTETQFRIFRKALLKRIAKNILIIFIVSIFIAAGCFLRS